jgi:hypothetical protein
MKWCRYRAGFLATLLCAAGAWAASPATAPARLEDRVNQVVQQLDSDSYQERQAAVDAGNQLPIEALPLLEAASQKPGVSPEVAAELGGVIKTLRRAAGKQTKYQTYLDYYRKHIAGEYRTVGKRNPKWDDAAEKFMEASAHALANFHDDRDEDIDLAALAAPLEAAGCDDPMLQYMIAKYAQPNRPTSARKAEQICDGVLAGGYSDMRKLVVLAWTAERHPGLRGAAKAPDKAITYYQQSADLWPAVLKAEPDIPAAVILPWLENQVEQDSPTRLPRKEIYDMLDAALAKALPEESLIRLNLKGEFLIKYAWDARGSGWANSVTQDGWKLFAERLAEADKVLSRCYELFPNSPYAATKMLTVELGQGNGRDRMEMWFTRAMKADPGNIAACRSKMWYLAPRWFGSTQEQLAFGRQCLEGAQFDSRVPLMVVDAHLNFVMPAKWGSAVNNPYFAKDEVWSDIAAAYDGYLQQHPNAWRLRSYYARYAWEAGKWKEAAALYQTLQNGPTAYRHAELNRVIQIDLDNRQKGRYAPDAGARAVAEARKNTEGFKRMTIEAYDQVGKKNPKWDDAARAALLAAAMAWGADPDCNFGEHDTMLEQSKKALDAGCDDPLVRFIYSNSVDSYLTPRGDTWKPTCFKDGAAMAASNYPAFIKFQSIMWGASFESWRGRNKTEAEKAPIRAALDSAVLCLKQVAVDRAVSNAFLRPEVLEVLQCYLALDGEAEEAFDHVQAELDAGDIDPITMKWIAARFRSDAITAVTPTGNGQQIDAEQRSKLMVTVREFETKAEALWKEDPTDPYASQMMMYLNQYTRHDRAWLGFWMHQAILADPGNEKVAIQGLNALQWAGATSQELSQYAEQCAAVPDYRSQIPFVQVEYLVRAARAGKKPDEKPDGTIIGRDDIWPKIAGVYEGYLAQFPLDSNRRSEYASLACLAGRWPIAAEQFKVLGDRVKPKAFYTQERLDACRAKIETLMGKGFLPTPPAVEQ